MTFSGSVGLEPASSWALISSLPVSLSGFLSVRSFSISDDTCHLQLRLKASPRHRPDRFSRRVAACSKQSHQTHDRNRFPLHWVWRRRVTGAKRPTMLVYFPPTSLWEWTVPKHCKEAKNHFDDFIFFYKINFPAKKTNNKQGTQCFKYKTTVINIHNVCQSVVSMLPPRQEMIPEFSIYICRTFPGVCALWISLWWCLQSIN